MATIATKTKNDTNQQPANYWQVFNLRSPKELDEHDGYVWLDENFEEVNFTPQGRLTYADYLLEEKLTGRYEAQLLLVLSGDRQQDSLMLVMPLRSPSAQHIVEPLCFLPNKTLLGSVISLHHYLYQTESHNYPEIRFRVKLNGEFFLNAPLSSSARWQDGFCYTRLEQIQKKLDAFALSVSTMQCSDLDF